MDQEKRKDLLEALKGSLEHIAQVDVERLIERDELGAINFKDAKEILDESVLLANDLLSLRFDFVPMDQLNTIAGSTNTFSTTLDKISGFKVTGHQKSPDTHRNNLVSQTERDYNQFLNSVVPWLHFLDRRSGGVQETVSEVMKFVAKAKEEINNSRTEIQKIVEAATHAASTYGVGRFTKVFHDIAEVHKRNGFRWLTATILLAFLTALVPFVLTLKQDWLGDPTTSVGIQHVIAKLVLVSVLSFLTFLFARNYRSHRHLEVLNRHRHHALLTFETFALSAGGDEQTKNAVLLETTRCIFSPAVSGYLKVEDETGGSPIIKVVEAFSKAAKQPS